MENIVEKERMLVTSIFSFYHKIFQKAFYKHRHCGVKG